ncbi:MAG: hypothetical protein WBX22_17680 [Silvibacterium sp.]
MTMSENREFVSLKSARIGLWNRPVVKFVIVLSKVEILVLMA